MPQTCILIALLALQPGGQAPQPAKATGPHPMITEVLYDVPGRLAGDANKDGKRTSGGDEFIELANLSDSSINLKGYTVLDSNAWEAREESLGGTAASPGGGTASPASPTAPVTQPAPRAPADPAKTTSPGGGRDAAPREKQPYDAPGQHVRFTFPDLTLKPGEVVVVFNGMDSTVPGAVGTSEGAAGENSAFGAARVFSMKTMSQYAALGNDGDWVLLLAPDGTPVQGLWWGSPKVEARPGSATIWMEAPVGEGSVQLERGSGKFKLHRTLMGNPKGPLFSPGEFGAPAEAAKPLK
ncbi:MAG: lamin tail domain-containing protein [Leptolyngbya sp. PLA1]|nr:lamin tail domain-containing protein [Leptolyngbya sp. PLA1]